MLTLLLFVIVYYVLLRTVYTDLLIIFRFSRSILGRLKDQSWFGFSGCRIQAHYTDVFFFCLFVKNVMNNHMWGLILKSCLGQHVKVRDLMFPVIFILEFPMVNQALVWDQLGFMHSSDGLKSILTVAQEV